MNYLMFIKVDKPNYRNIEKCELYEEIDKRKILPLWLKTVMLANEVVRFQKFSGYSKIDSDLSKQIVNSLK